jgi:regulator of cell morphogenesis and NO signaling
MTFTTFNTAKTVRDIAIEMPDATRVFEKFKIDYCCGGARTLDEACAKVGANLNEVIQSLNESVINAEQKNEAIDLKSVSLTELIYYILDKHHAFTNLEMRRIGELLAKVYSVHGANHPELLKLQNLFRELCDDIKPHMHKEERALFPYIIQMENAAERKSAVQMPPFGSVQNPVRMMMFEHDNVGEILRRIREVTSGYTTPPDACFSYQTLYNALEAFEKDLHQHIHLENNVLFPRAVALEASFFTATKMAV